MPMKKLVEGLQRYEEQHPLQVLFKEFTKLKVVSLYILSLSFYCFLALESRFIVMGFS